VFPNLPNVFELLDGDGGYKHENWKVYFHDFPVSAPIDYVWKSSEGMVCSFDTSDYGEFSLLPTFAADVQNNKLPKYSFIEPRYGGLPFGHLPPNDNHPPFDVRYGEVLLGTVYNLLRASSYWPQTLLIVTYDEHGGCFDHVIPPPAVAPGGTRLRNWHPSSFTFNRYGPRVPALLVSPYIPAESIVRPAGFCYVQGMVLRRRMAQRRSIILQSSAPSSTASTSPMEMRILPTATRTLPAWRMLSLWKPRT
jgi:phospholipase C